MTIEERDRDLFNRIVEHYAKKDFARSSSIVRKYQLMFAVRPVLERLRYVDTILDIGCGVGASAKYIAGHYKRYIGVDQSEELIKAARIFNRGSSNVAFLAGNIKSTKFPMNTVDLVLSVGALHHMTELDEVMESLIRIAKSQGYFVAIEAQNGNPVVQTIRWLTGKLSPLYSSEQHFFSQAELVSFLSKHGLQNIEIEFQGFLSPPFAQVVLPFQALATSLSKLVVAADNILDKHLPRIFRFLSWNIIVRARFP